MKFWKFICGLVLVLVTLATAIAILSIALNQVTLYDYYFALKERARTFWTLNLLAFIIGAGLLFADIMFLVLSVSTSPKDRMVRFASEHGEIRISIKAVEDFIQRLTLGISSVVNARAIVDVSDEGLNATVRMAVEVGRSVPDICVEVQQKIKSNLQNRMGIPNVSSVVVEVTETTFLEEENEEVIRDDKGEDIGLISVQNEQTGA